MRRRTKIRGSYDWCNVVKPAKVQPNLYYMLCPTCNWGIWTREKTMLCGLCKVEMKEMDTWIHPGT